MTVVYTDIFTFHGIPLFIFQEVDENVDDEMVKAFIKMEIKFKFRDKVS